jgi:hypothetical protein
MRTKVTQNVKNFLGDLVATCYSNNVTLKLLYQKQINLGKIKCSGMFDQKSLQVAINNDLEIWLGVLVHESCHMDQYIEDMPIWREIDPYLRRVDRWLADPQYKILKKAESFERVIELELDCEKRAVKKIKDYNLPLSLEEYVKGANSYLFAYGATMLHRKWFKHPYKKESIKKKMPKRFLSLADYTNQNHPALQEYARVYKTHI